MLEIKADFPQNFWKTWQIRHNPPPPQKSEVLADSQKDTQFRKGYDFSKSEFIYIQLFL